MATVVKKENSRFWHAAFRIPQGGGKGKLVFRSTKKTNKREAMMAAFDMERAARAEANADEGQARRMLAIITRATEDVARGSMTEKLGREYITEIVKIATGQEINDYSVKSWCDEWLMKQSGLTDGTLTNYRAGIKSFLVFLGDRKNQTIKGVTTSDVIEYRQWLIDGGGKGKPTTKRTANQKTTIVSIIFKAAADQAVIEKSPAAGIKKLDSEVVVTRKPFTREEVNQLILAAPDDEWRRFLTLATFTGLRMSDCKKLEWSKIDMKKRSITLMPRKTIRRRIEISIPIHPTLHAALSEVGDRDGFVFPSLAGADVGGASGLSKRFTKLMGEAGVSRGQVTFNGNKKLHERSFHSFRHTITSWLGNAGVSPEFRKSITGHTSDDTHKLYTHIDQKLLADAMNSIPTLTDKKS
jgi:integrase